MQCSIGLWHLIRFFFCFVSTFFWLLSFFLGFIFNWKFNYLFVSYKHASSVVQNVSMRASAWCLSSSSSIGSLGRHSHLTSWRKFLFIFSITSALNSIPVFFYKQQCIIVEYELWNYIETIKYKWQIWEWNAIARIFWLKQKKKFRWIFNGLDWGI